MQKVIIHEFDPLIYPRKLWVCTNATTAGLMLQFDIDQKQTDESIKINGVTTCLTRNSHTKRLGILIFCTNKKLLTTSNIAHEAVHFADAVFEAIGAIAQDYEQGNEPYAYLVGWAADCMDKVIKGNKF